MKIKEVAQNAFGMVLAILLFIGCFIAAYFLTSFIYKYVGKSPSAFLVQMINSILGTLLALLLIKIAFLLEQRKSSPFEPVIKAQEKIAGGDFTVRMDKKTEGIGPLGDLVDSVNNLALELSRMEKMRQEFISNVSHEIQSPLTSIRGFAQALRNSSLSPEKRERYLNIIEAESMRLSKLSDNLLKLASLETDTIKFEPKVYRLDKQLRNIFLSCEPQWSKKNINMEFSLEEIEINADEDMLSQVWINLIHNSIKFTAEGGNVTVDLYKDDHIDFKISDTGIGIDEEDQIRVFERFYKADKSRSHSIKGNGLGLSIVKKIVEMHHGTIDVKSELGKGTTFIVSLPKG